MTQTPPRGGSPWFTKPDEVLNAERGCALDGARTGLNHRPVRWRHPAAGPESRVASKSGCISLSDAVETAARRPSGARVVPKKGAARQRDITKRFGTLTSLTTIIIPGWRAQVRS